MSIVLQAWKDGLRPDPQIGVDEWRNKYRHLSESGASEHGKLDSNRTPYTIEIADHLSPQSPTQQVFVCKGVQVAITELGNDFLFTYAHLYSRPMMGVLPTKPLLEDHVKSKVWSGVNASPVLKNEVFYPIKQGSTKTSSTLKMVMKKSGTTLNWRWAESKSTYASVTYGAILASDVDRWPDDVEGEGDPISLLQKRLDTFGSRKKFFCESSPTKRRNSKIYAEAMYGDRNYYNMKCPHCDEYIKFSEENFVYEYDKESYELISDVTYKCPHNDCIIKEYEKTEMMALENGAKWIPENPNFRNPLRKTYFLPSYYSPWKSWFDIFTEYLIALGDKEKHGKTKKLKVWYNTIDGSVYDDETEKEVETTLDQLLQRREEYTKVPKDVVLLSAGVDTQGNRLEVSVYGWVNDQERYLIAHYIVTGDLKERETKQMLDALLFEKFFEIEDGGEMKIFCSAMDTGGDKTQEVYEYILKRYKSKRIYAVKGGKSIDDPLVKDFSMTKTKRGKPLKLYTLGVNSAKDDLISDIEEQMGTRYIHFPHNIQKFYEGVVMEHDMSDDAFLNQFLVETKDEEGRWKNEFNRRNEGLDCAIYAKAAIKCTKGLDVKLVQMAKVGKRAFYRKKK